MKTIKYISCFLILLFCVEGCASKNAPIETPNLSGDSPIPIHTQEAPTLIQPSGKVIYDSSYLQDCRLQYPIKNDRQVGFRNVYPGITTVPDMITQFGQPDNSEVYQGQDYYIFDNKEAGYVYNFSTKNNIIEEISLDDPEIVVPLKDILNIYGCPDFMVAEALENDIPGAPIIFNSVYFNYLTAGLFIRFDGYPIKYSSIPVVFNFTRPVSLEDYLKPETEFMNSKYHVLVSFSEAVIQK
jgi:hypothetical protein